MIGINAQEAYKETLLNLKDLDTTDLFITATNRIQEAVKFGSFATGIYNIESISLAEKFAIQLEKHGYCCQTIAGQPVFNQADNSYKPTYGVVINWKSLAPNTREDYDNII